MAPLRGRIPPMTLPPGKLLLAAAVLLGAALAQGAKSAEQPESQSAPAAHRVVAHGPLTVPIGRRTAAATTTPPSTGQRRTGQNSTGQNSTGQNSTGQGKTGGKVIYLTFDDGPQRVWTPKMLSLLEKYHAKATFFFLGREAAAHPELVATTRGLGHTIGNHTWDHPKLTKLSDAQIRQQISTGVKSRCFRPPFRDTDARVAAAAAQYGQRQVLWDVDTKDWAKPGAAKIERAILRGARPGAIILIHDGGGDRSQTHTALSRVLPELTRQGYTFHPLPC